MIDVKKVEALVSEHLSGSELFVVGVSVSPSNEIEIVIDSDTAVDIDSCVSLSRAVEAALDREQEDFELTVSSAGVCRPLVLPRQYRKLVGKSVEVVLKNGLKITGRLDGFENDAVTVTYPERMAVEGSKKKKTVEKTETFSLDEIKTTKEHLDFK